ncbi:MAG TPA: hypothetical protein V6D12_21445 [Candidatus Obscuribacterales bacterium]
MAWLLELKVALKRCTELVEVCEALTPKFSVGKGVSIFVSYADIPPIVGVEPPTAEDIISWRKRWKNNKFKAPDFWVEFYAQKFKKAPYLEKLYAWGKVVSAIKFGLSQVAIYWLRGVYAQEKEYCLQSF